jgi:hypothetical protein
LPSQRLFKKGNNMNDSEYRELVETSWRRVLTEEEQARLRGWVAAHPAVQADWEAETTLSQTLARLPDAPVSSNFTAQVMQAIDREDAAAIHRGSLTNRLMDMFRDRAPRVAWAVLLIGAVWIGIRQHEKTARHELAQGLAALVNVAAQPDPRVLQDMGAIQHLSQLPAREDDELLKVLSQ